MNIFEFCGHLGVVCFLIAFLLLQRGKLAGDSYWYLYLNLAGAILLMVSLSHNWNLSAFVLEACWGLISIYGLFKRYRAPSLRGGEAEAAMTEFVAILEH